MVKRNGMFRVISLSADGPLKKRLEALGFLPGEPIEVIIKSRIKGWPIVVVIGGTQIALRAGEASLIRVIQKGRGSSSLGSFF